MLETSVVIANVPVLLGNVRVLLAVVTVSATTVILRAFASFFNFYTTTRRCY